MGVRGEMFSTKVALDNRTYFFNVKENRNGDIFMTVVESKPSESEGFDRHQIVLFADDTRQFLQGFESALAFVDKELSRRRKIIRDRRPAQDREERPAPGPREGQDRGPAGKRAAFARKSRDPSAPARPPKAGQKAHQGPARHAPGRPPAPKRKATVKAVRPDRKD